MLMLIGTYTRGTDSQGVYAFEVSDDCRRFAPGPVSTDIDNPSWLVRHPHLDVVYSVNEVQDLNGGGGVSAYACDENGRLTLIDSKPSMGADPCHLAIDAAGSLLCVSNYTGGNLASFALHDSGALGDMQSLVQHGGKGVDPMRQKGPHVHSIALDKHARHAYVCDLGLDQVVRYPLAAGGMIRADQRITSRLRPGAGPRLMCFDSDEQYGYVINELDNSIVSFGRDEAGDLTELASYSALPAGFADASYCAHIAVSGDDRFLYASNRGHDSIAVFRIEGGGRLELVQHQPSLGKHPRHFALSPDEGHLLIANRDSNNLVVMERDAETGRLTPTGTEITVPAAVCIVF